MSNRKESLICELELYDELEKRHQHPNGVNSYSSDKELESAGDGKITFIGKKLDNNDFTSEKEMSAFLVDNAESLASDIFNDTLVVCHEDRPIRTQNAFTPRGKRIDILLDCIRSIYILELKNPKHLSENRGGIGQLLDYGREIAESYNKPVVMALITTKFDRSTALTIDHYSLPIKYYYFNKRQILEYKGVL